ncbi:MAG: response regulator, partial [Halorubrum sp.]
MSRTTERRGGRDGSPRVVIVDDSPFMRGLIADLLTDAGVAVVGEAGDGAEALSVVAETRPDVVTMDVEMPGMGGLEAVERLMDETPTPVLMLSAHTAEGAEVTFEALERGAVDFFSKPGGEVSTGVSREADRLVEAVRSVADADLDAATRGRRERDSGQTASASSSGGSDARSSPGVDGPLTVVIGASTGGPNAVERVMSALPMGDCRVVIVQHMPEAFTPRFADRLDDASAYDVSEASDGA